MSGPGGARPTIRRRRPAVAVAAVLLAGLGAAGCGGDPEPGRSAKAAAEGALDDRTARAVAAAYFCDDQVREARAALRPLLERRDPAVADLGAAAIVELSDGRLDEATRLLDRARRLAPHDPAPSFNLARVARRRADFAGAVAHLRRAVEQAPDDVPTRFALAGALADLERPDEAAALYEKIAAADGGASPGLAMAALYQLSRLDLQAGRTAEGQARLDEFHRLEAQGRKATSAFDLERGTFGRVLPPPPRPPARTRPHAPPSIARVDVVLPALAGARGLFAAALDEAPALRRRAAEEGVGARPGLPALIVWGDEGLFVARVGADGAYAARRVRAGPVSQAHGLDLDGDGRLDVVLVAGGRPSVLLARGDEWTPLLTPLPDLPSGPVDVEALDVDGDGDLDLAWVGPFGVRLWRNDGLGAGGLAFTDVTADAGLPGDVPLAWALADDFDGDGHADLLVGGEKGCRLATRVRPGVFVERTADLGPSFPAARRPALAGYDDEGRPGLYFPGPPARWLFAAAQGRFGSREAASSATGPLEPPWVAADLDLDGAVDLVCGTSSGVLALVLGAGLPGETAAVLSGAGATGGPAPFVVADLDGDLHEEVVRATARGLEILHLAPPPGPAPYALRVSLRGGTDERRGVGAVLEVRAGDLYRRIAWRGEPVVIGLGDRMRVDVLQVTWPDGSMQHEIGWFADGECVLEQRDRRAMGSH